jgi:subtilisin family serine protease
MIAVGQGADAQPQIPLRSASSLNDSEERLVIRFQAGYDLHQAQRYLHELGLVPIKYLHQIDAWITASHPADAEAYLSSLNSDPRVMWSEADGLIHASEVIPNDSFFLSRQENLRVIDLPSAWVFATGDSRPIAIIDSGVDLDHPDLGSKIWINPDEIPDNEIDDDTNGYVDDIRGWNFVADEPDPQDDYSHGSHVAGIAAAQTDNQLGIAGVSWKSQIMALKALDNVGIGQASDAAEAILYAADMGANIINLSWGAGEEYQVVTAAVEYAQDQGCLIIASAGNGATEVHYPAALPGVLAVASTGNTDLPSSFSNRGPQIDIAAPGEDIFSANRSGSYYIASGTSASTPHVSGLAALVWSMRPEWSPIQVSEVITRTARDIWTPGRDNLTGWGRIDAYAAIDETIEHYYFPFVVNNIVDTP